MIAGLALALGSALGTNVAFLFKQRGAVLAPPVRGRHPLRSAAGLFRSRWFSLGWAFGVSDIALKYLNVALHGGLQGIVSEWTLTALAASVLAFYAAARGLQLGPGVAVIAFTSVAANLAAIMGDILVFRDPIAGSARSRSSDA